MPTVFLSLWSSHPEISLHSGKVVSVAQCLSFAEQSFPEAKGKTTVVAAPSMGGGAARA